MKGLKHLKKAQEISTNLYDKRIKSLLEKEGLYKNYLEHLKKSAYAGNGNAQFELGLQYEEIYFFGSNPNYNPTKSFFWYKKACENNIAEACNNLAVQYEAGKGCDKDILAALSLYDKAAKLGCPWAKHNYTKLYKSTNKNQPTLLLSTLIKTATRVQTSKPHFK